MTAKEQLRERVEALSEEEASEALRLLEQHQAEPVIAAFRDARVDDEPISPEEEAAVQQAREEIARGGTITLEQLRTELDRER